MGTVWHTVYGNDMDKPSIDVETNNDGHIYLNQGGDIIVMDAMMLEEVIDALVDMREKWDPDRG